ncbi:hypothetical protein C8F01DRAFT_1184905 [Mycena amicta]|nr:hypothetical protein C8F01DRAFT_1184905 [Mycena amicta]
MSSTEPVFPAEIEREILETCALLHPGTVPTLLRVCRRSYIWSVPRFPRLRLEPLLYHTVRTSNHHQLAALARYLSSTSKPGSLLRDSDVVRAVCVEHDGDTAHNIEKLNIEKLLALSLRITDMAIVPQSIPTLLSILTPSHHLTRLTASLYDLFGEERTTRWDTASRTTTVSIDPIHPIFRFLTHLDSLDNPSSDLLTQLATLPALTHLCFSMPFSPIPWALVETLLARVQLRLAVLVFMYDSRWPPSHADGFNQTGTGIDDTVIPTAVRDDMRVVAGWFHDDTAELDVWREWELSARHRGGVPDFWARAERLVAMRRRGEIARIRYLLIMSNSVTRYWIGETTMTPPDSPRVKSAWRMQY